MHIVDPSHFFRRLDRRDVEIDHDRLLPASHEHAFEGMVRGGADLLMRHGRRNENEIAGPGLRGELEVIAPTHSGIPLHDVDYALEFAVMMSAGLCVGMNAYSAGPKLRGSCTRVSNRSGAIHPRCLRSVGIHVPGTNNPNSMKLPVGHF